MQLNTDNLISVVGDIRNLSPENINPVKPFDEERISFLDSLSKLLLNDTEVREYPDVVSFAFWIRRANMVQYMRKYNDIAVRKGRGIVFHIAPSNIAVNFAFSFVVGFLAGNTNIVRLPAKPFRQTDLICRGIDRTIKDTDSRFSNEIFFIRYGHDDDINRYFSEICDVRVIWGGDNSIRKFRDYPLKPRAKEISFSDRFSAAVLDAHKVCESSSLKRLIIDFYNDTYLNDQNACSSPKWVFWYGEHDEIMSAKDKFWKALSDYIHAHYQFQDIVGIDKLTKSCIVASERPGVKMIKDDNYLVRLEMPDLDCSLIDYAGNGGMFFETDISSLDELSGLSDQRVQTLAYFGDFDFSEVIDNISYGIDRVVPIGHTLDFDLTWDGYDLIRECSRIINIMGRSANE